MNAVMTIACKEIRSQFLSPRTFAILAVNAALLGYLLLVQLERFAGLQGKLGSLTQAPGATELVILPLVKTAGFLFLVSTPLLTMNLLAEERRLKTLPLLLSSPVTGVQIVLGKYLGWLVFAACLIFITGLLAFSLALGGPLDFGLMLSALLGLTLLLACMGAAGLVVSCYAAQPSVAAFNTFGLLMVLWIINWGSDFNAGGAASVLTYLSLGEHFEQFLSGVVRLQDVAYFVLLVAVFLTVATGRLEKETRAT